MGCNKEERGKYLKPEASVAALLFDYEILYLAVLNSE